MYAIVETLRGVALVLVMSTAFLGVLLVCASPILFFTGNVRAARSTRDAGVAILLSWVLFLLMLVSA